MADRPRWRKLLSSQYSGGDVNEHVNGRSAEGGLVYPYAPPAPDGSAVEVAPGILWLRMPMPMQLDHINVYCLRDDDGWFIIDTGLPLPKTQALWDNIRARHFGGMPVLGVVCTHFHYDHAGCAAWLAESTGASLYMSHGEFYTLRAMNAPGLSSDELFQGDFYRQAGLEEGIITRMADAMRADPYRPPLPRSFRRLRAGDVLRVGGRNWQVWIGEGHSPEHVCLYCPEDRILISGDQLLPRISSNVLVMPIEPEANPLGDWLDSLERMRELAEDTLVLPSHERVFCGLRLRVEQLVQHHLDQCGVLIDLASIEERMTIAQGMRALFKRKLGPVEIMMAIGETLAHLTWLVNSGKLRRTIDAKGIIGYDLPVVGSMVDSKKLQETN